MATVQRRNFDNISQLSFVPAFLELNPALNIFSTKFMESADTVEFGLSVN